MPRTLPAASRYRAAAGLYHTLGQRKRVLPVLRDHRPLPLRDPQVPVVTNIAGQVRTSADHIRAELASQIVAPVEWVVSVREMVANGVDTFVEIGPGQVLSRLIRRISSDVKAISLNDAVVALVGPREESAGK